MVEVVRLTAVMTRALPALIGWLPIMGRALSKSLFARGWRLWAVSRSPRSARIAHHNY